MQIRVRSVFPRSEANILVLKRAGILAHYQRSSVRLLAEFDDGSDEALVVERLHRDGHGQLRYQTSFDEKDLERADWLVLTSTKVFGYPLGSDYFDKVYKADCAACGSGKRQVHPFRIKRNPAWKRNTFKSLHGVEDEFFVNEDLFRDVFAPLGLDSFPVLVGARGEVRASGVVQLVVPEEPGLQFDILDRSDRAEMPGRTQCGACGSDVYQYVSRGGWPSIVNPPERDLYFPGVRVGGCRCAWRLAVVSAKLYRLLRDAGVKGLGFSPVVNSAYTEIYRV